MIFPETLTTIIWSKSRMKNEIPTPKVYAFSKILITHIIRIPAKNT